jgi:hypothetical protein
VDDKTPSDLLLEAISQNGVLAKELIALRRACRIWSRCMPIPRGQFREHLSEVDPEASRALETALKDVP